MTRKCDPITAHPGATTKTKIGEPSRMLDNDPKLEDRRVRPILTNEYYYQTDIKLEQQTRP